MQNKYFFKKGKLPFLILFVVFLSCKFESDSILTFKELDSGKLKKITLNVPDIIKDNASYFEKIRVYNQYIIAEFGNRNLKLLNKLFLFDNKGELKKVVELEENKEIYDFDYSQGNLLRLIYFNDKDKSYFYCEYDLAKMSYFNEKKIFTVDINHSDFLYPFFNDGNIHILKNKIIFTFINSQLYKQKQYKKFPIIGYFDLEKESLNFIELWYPELNDSTFYPKNYYYTSCNMINDSICLISFCYTNTVYKWNVVNNSISIDSFSQSRYVKKINSKTNTKNDNEFEFENFLIYEQLLNLFDSEGKKYIARYIKLPEIKYGNEYGLMEFYDEKLNFSGAKIIKAADNISEHLISNINKNENVGVNNKNYEVFFTKLNFEKISINYLNDSLFKIENCENEKNQNINNRCMIGGENNSTVKYELLLKHFSSYIQDSNYNVIVINFDGCHSCTDYISNFYSSNKSLISTFKPTLYIIYLYNNQADSLNLNKYLTERNISKTNVYILKSEVCQKILKSTITNNFFLSVQNNILSEYKEYKPNNVQNIWTDILAKYGYKIEYQK